MASILQILGAPGSGKSLVAESLAKVLKAELYPEPLGQNEYLPKLSKGDSVHFAYQARSLHLAIYQETKALTSSAKLAIVDGGVFQVLGVSAALCKMGKITEDEFEALGHIAK